jgi:hypothetical protein
MVELVVEIFSLAILPSTIFSALSSAITVYKSAASAATISIIISHRLYSWSAKTGA